MSVTASAAGQGDDAEYAAEEAACATDLAFAQQLADARARDRVAADSELGIDDHVVSGGLAELLELLDVALGFVSEVEAFAFMYFFNSQPCA